ncbi:MAG: type II toxin-antitoxin system VapC family toxin [Gammaproteobacteria bacterium]|nr:type II toxin-antitoxin system VapC family toxin [Gammaproteobacteria bacterium]
MKLPDVNVLVQAFRSDSHGHQQCRDWMSATVNSPSSFGVSPLVLSGFVRVTTHPKIFATPNSTAESLAFAEFLLQRPNAIMVHPGERHWTIFAELCRNVQAKGNLVPDAWFAALAIETGCQWITLDRDFARFDGLNWSVP